MSSDNDDASTSDKTIPFYYQPENDSSEIALRTNTKCNFDMQQLFNREQDFLLQYELFKSAAHKLNKAHKIQRELRSIPRLNNKIDEIRAICQKWDKEAGEIHRQRLMHHGDDFAKQTPDELLAKIKRLRWCHICLNSAQFQEDQSMGKFFCSMECQLNYYDS